MEHIDIRKTLVINNGTKFMEYYGYVPGHGWCTASSPIHHFAENATWKDIKKGFRDVLFESLDGVELVTIEIRIIT